MFVRLSSRGTVTIPKKLRQGLSEETLLEAVRREDGVIELRPRAVTDPDQAWFWTEEWQQGEREVDEDIAAGRVHVFDDAESFLAALEAEAARLDGEAASDDENQPRG
jgi:antitoxin MazE